VCCGIRWLQEHDTGSCPEQDTSFPHPPFAFFKMHFNIFLASTPISSIVLFPSGFQSETLCAILSSPVCATCSADLTVLDLIIVIRFGEQYKSLELFIMQFYPATFHFLCRLFPDTFLNTLFSSSLNLCSFVSMKDHVFRIRVMKRKPIC